MDLAQGIRDNLHTFRGGEDAFAEEMILNLMRFRKKIFKKSKFGSDF